MPSRAIYLPSALPRAFLGCESPAPFGLACISDFNIADTRASIARSAFQAKLSTLRAAAERSVSDERAAGGGGGVQQAPRRTTTSQLR